MLPDCKDDCKTNMPQSLRVGQVNYLSLARKQLRLWLVLNQRHLLSRPAPFNRPFQRGGKSSVVTQDTSDGKAWGFEGQAERGRSHPHMLRQHRVLVDRLQILKSTLWQLRVALHQLEPAQTLSVLFPFRPTL
jgi:hypothetical protein